MNELSNTDFETYNLPTKREFSPTSDIDPSITKLGSKVTHILIEAPQEVEVTPVEVRHALSDLDNGKVIDN